MMIEFNLVMEYKEIIKTDATCDESIEELLRDSTKYQDRYIALIFDGACGFYTFDEAVTYIVNCCDKAHLLLKRLIEVLEETEINNNELC